MKLHEFDHLCRTEWDNGHGHVKTLWLLQDSIKELQEDIMNIGTKGKFLPVKVEDIPRLHGGDRPMYVVNPLTREEVKMRIARDMDVADVVFPDGHFETHVLNRK